MAAGNRRRPTIIDVAARARVSKSTAARVLAGGASSSAAARAAVLAAAKAVGYERNHLAVGMRSGRSGLLALVIPDIANPFWAEVARGAQDRASEGGLSLLVFSSDWDADREAAHLRALRRARVDGAIVNPIADGPAAGGVDELGRFGLPFVLIGSAAERFSGAPSVGSDIAQGVTLGMDHLVSKGHEAPALILGTAQRLARARFVNAVRVHCVTREVDPARLSSEDGGYTVEGGQAAMRRLLARHRTAGSGGGPLAVFAANDMMALGALMAVREAGLDCPGEVSILGFDGIPASGLSWPPLTTVRKPAREIGRRSVEGLLAQIDGAGGPGPEHLHLACALLDRGSVRDLGVRPGKAVA
jgi:LacI family transcriptional regulator